MPTEHENTQEQPAQPQDKQPKYFMIIVKDEGYTCPEERDVLTNEIVQNEEYLPPAVNPEEWWFENSDFCGLVGGNTIEAIFEMDNPSSILTDIATGTIEAYKPTYLTDEERKSIEEDAKNVIRQSQSR